MANKFRAYPYSMLRSAARFEIIRIVVIALAMVAAVTWYVLS